jgi:hypothetical protein
MKNNKKLTGVGSRELHDQFGDRGHCFGDRGWVVFDAVFPTVKGHAT